MKSIIGRITSIRSPRQQSKAVSVGFHGSRERGGCYLPLLRCQKLWVADTRSCQKLNHSVDTLRSSEICTVSIEVTVDLHRQLRPEKGNIQDASEESEEKETKSHDGWDINDSTRPVSGCIHQWFQLTIGCSWAHLPSMLETWIKFTPGCLSSDKINQQWKVVKNQKNQFWISKIKTSSCK